MFRGKFCPRTVTCRQALKMSSKKRIPKFICNIKRDFQNGAFKLAIKEGVPVLPIAIAGTGAAIPKGTWLFQTMIPATVKVLPAIDVSGLGPADFAKLRDMARHAIESA